MSNSHHSIYFPDYYLLYTFLLLLRLFQRVAFEILSQTASAELYTLGTVHSEGCQVIPFSWVRAIRFTAHASGVMRPAQQISRNLLGFKIVNFNLKEKMFPFCSYIWNKRLKNMWVASCYSDSSKISKSKSQSFYIAFSECSTISPSLWNFLITRIIIFRRLFPARTPFTTVSVWGSASTLCAFPKVPSWTVDKLSHGPASSSQFLHIFMHDCQNLSFLYYR